MTVAFETAARLTSDSVIPPTARCTNDRRTSSCSWSSLRSASVSASSEPCTSALSTRLSVATSPRCTIAKMSSRRAPPARLIGCFRLAARRRWARASATVRAVFSSGATRSSSPASGTSSRPSTSTGTDGPASGDLLAVLVEHRAHLAPRAAGDDRVADAQRAALDERGDDRAAALVEVRLEHERTRRRLRVGDELLDLGDEQDRLEQLVDADARRAARRRRRSCRRPTPRARARARRAAGARGSGRRPRGRPW